MPQEWQLSVFSDFFGPSGTIELTTLEEGVDDDVGFFNLFVEELVQGLFLLDVPDLVEKGSVVVLEPGGMGGDYFVEADNLIDKIAVAPFVVERGYGL